MKKLYTIALIASIAQISLLHSEDYPNLKDLGLEDQLFISCSSIKLGFFASEAQKNAKKQCDLLEKAINSIQQKGCSDESLGLGFKGAMRHFLEQDPETQKLIYEIRKQYLASNREKGKKEIESAINEILPGNDNYLKRHEISKLNKLGNRLAEEYGEYLKREKPEMLKRKEEQEKKKRNRF
jgi:hypothetical protein